MIRGNSKQQFELSALHRRIMITELANQMLAKLEDTKTFQ